MPLPAIYTRIVSGVCQKNFIQVAENQSKIIMDIDRKVATNK